MEDKSVLTSEQRLEIIEQMINTAKGKFCDNSFQFLLWGWVIALANLGHYVLLHYSLYEKPEMIWLITFPAAIVSAIYGYRQGRKSTVTTYTDRVSMWIWITFFVCLMTLMFFIKEINFMITPLILLFTAFATFLSGTTIKFKPLMFGGIMFWIAAIIGFNVAYETQLLVASGAIVLGYLVPGYLLKSKNNNGQV